MLIDLYKIWTLLSESISYKNNHYATYVYSPVGWSSKICWLLLYRYIRPLTTDSPEYDTKLHLIVRLQFWSTSSLPLLPDPLWVVVPVVVTSMCQTEPFNLLTVCKQIAVVKLLVLDSNTWNHLCANKWTLTCLKCYLKTIPFQIVYIQYIFV